MKQSLIDDLTRRVAATFPSFGGGRQVWGNPIAAALKDEPPQFAAGVDVRKVVQFVLKRAKTKPLIAYHIENPGGAWWVVYAKNIKAIRSWLANESGEAPESRKIRRASDAEVQSYESQKGRCESID